MIFWKNWYLLILIAPLLVVAFFQLSSWYRKMSTFQFSGVSSFKDLPRGWKSRIHWLPFVLKATAGALAIMALARPQVANQKVKKKVEGIDIMIALDISDSMLIEDMKPKNRLESAKKTIETFIKGRDSDKIGLVVFSGESYTRVPPTLDYEMLLESVSQVETSRTIKMGTALGVSLANAVSRLKTSQAKSKVIVFLTDGENNSGTIDPITALNIAKGYHVRIYTIGVGQDGPTRLPIYTKDAFGNTRKSYQPFVSTVNENLLEQMARETGGKYYRASTTSSLEGVFQDIDTLEKTKIEINRFTRYEELFPSFLFAGLFFFSLGVFLENSLLKRAS